MDRPLQPVAQPSSKKDKATTNVEDSSAETQVTSEEQPGDAVKDTPTDDTPTKDTPSDPIQGPGRQGPDVEVTEEGKDNLKSFIYNYPGYDLGPIKTRAILCHIYYLAINDKWFQARDLMLMSHLQEGIQFADVPTQVSRVKCMLRLLVVACVCTWIPAQDIRLGCSFIYIRLLVDRGRK